MKSRESRKSATYETRADFKADIEAALTPEQPTQFEGNIKAIRAQMRAPRKARQSESVSSTN